MKKILYILILSVLTTSCATIFNKPHTSVRVNTTEPSMIVYRQDTVKTVNNAVTLQVERNKDPLSLVVITDSLTKSVEIKAINSEMFNANFGFIVIIPLYGIFPSALAYAIDWDNPKSYTYPFLIYINPTNTGNSYYRYGWPAGKGSWNLHLSIPAVNYFLITPPENENAISNIGSLGVSVGVDYYHSHDRFVNLTVSYALNIPDYIEGSFIYVSNNHKLRQRFSVGYGVSSAFYRKGPGLAADYRHNALGFVFPAYFQTGERFNIGLVYRPTFYRPNLPDKFIYEHSISLDLAWKIRLNK